MKKSSKKKLSAKKRQRRVSVGLCESWGGKTWGPILTDRQGESSLLALPPFDPGALPDSDAAPLSGSDRDATEASDGSKCTRED